MKVNNKEKFEVKYSFLKPLSQNFEVLTSCGDIKKVQIGVSCTNLDRKMKIKSERYSEVNYSFMKPFLKPFLY